MKDNRTRNLLFLNPWIYDFAAYDFWAKPLGFLYLASLLRKNGFAISYIDCLDSDHPKITNVGALNAPVRKKDGKGRFYKERIEKPNPLRSIPKHYSRYGMPRDLYLESLEKSVDLGGRRII